MHQLATKKTLPLAIAGATLLSLATVGTAPANAALFRLTANLNYGNQFSITYDGDKLGTVEGDNINYDDNVYYEGNVVDFSFVSPTFSYSLADFGTPAYGSTTLYPRPLYEGQQFIDIRFTGPSNKYLVVGLPVTGEPFSPSTPTSLYTESRGSILPAPGGPLTFGSPNFKLVLDDRDVLVDPSGMFLGGQAIVLNSGGTYEIARVPIASTPEPVVPWWVAGALVGGWWLRGLRVGRKQ